MIRPVHHHPLLETILLAALAALVFPAAALAKSDPAKEKAKLQAEFKKLVDKLEAAKKEAPLTQKKCLSFAGDFADLAKDRHAPEGFINAASLYASCGDPKKHEQAVRDALAMNPNFAPAHAALGEIMYKRGEVIGAGMEYDAALKADPRSAEAYTGQALLLVEKAKGSGDRALYGEAVGKLRRALAIDSDSMPAYGLLALIYYQLAESDRAKLDLAALVCKQAKEVNDKYAPIYNTLGLINLKRRNVTGALKEFRTAAELDPKYVEAQLNIGAITLSARDYVSAEKAFKAVLDANPANPQQRFDATMGMGVALRGQRRVDEAEQWYGKARQLDPRACAVAYNLGVLYQDYKMAEDNSHLNKAKGLFNEFIACGHASNDKLDDAKRRIKDVDDTFKAIAEAKKMEEEAKKLAEEAAAMQKQADEQACQYWKTQMDEAKKKNTPPPPPPNDKCGVPMPPPAASPTGPTTPAGAPVVPAAAQPEKSAPHQKK